MFNLLIDRHIGRVDFNCIGADLTSLTDDYSLVVELAMYTDGTFDVWLSASRRYVLNISGEYTLTRTGGGSGGVVAHTPEPSAALLFAAGAIVLAGRRRGRRG